MTSIAHGTIEYFIIRRTIGLDYKQFSYTTLNYQQSNMRLRQMESSVSLAEAGSGGGANAAERAHLGGDSNENIRVFKQ